MLGSKGSKTGIFRVSVKLQVGVDSEVAQTPCCVVEGIIRAFATQDDQTWEISQPAKMAEDYATVTYYYYSFLGYPVGPVGLFVQLEESRMRPSKPSMNIFDVLFLLAV